MSRSIILETLTVLGTHIPENETVVGKLEEHITSSEVVMIKLSSRIVELSVCLAGSDGSGQDLEANVTNTKLLLSDLVGRTESLEQLVQGVLDCRESVLVFVGELQPLLMNFLSHVAVQEEVFRDMEREKEKMQLWSLMQCVTGRVMAVKGRLDGMKLRLDGIRLHIYALKIAMEQLRDKIEDLESA